MEVVVVDLAGVVEGGGGQGVVGDAVDLSRHAVGGLEQDLERGRSEQGELGAGQAQAVLEVAGQLVAGEPREVVAHDDALVEKFLEEGELTYEEITQGIQIGVRDRSFFPICAVSTMHGGVGMRPLLHCIKEYLPASDVRPEIKVLKGDAETTAQTGAGSPTGS